MRIQTLTLMGWLVLVLFANTEPSQAQAIFKEELKQLIDTSKKLLEPTLNEGEQAIFRATEFRVVDNLNTIASPYAAIENGKRVIVFSTGFYRMLYAMGDLALIQKSGKYGDEITTRYFNYALPRLFENSRKPVHLRAFVKYPSDYFQVSKEELLEWHTTNETSMIFTGITLGSVSMVIAHELGHQVLGHASKEARDLADSRKAEADADQWAVEHLLAADVIPITGMYALIFYYFQDQDAIAHEEQRSHPSEIKRIETMVQATISNLPRFRERMRANGVSEQTIKEGLLNVLQAIKQDIQSTRLR